MEFSSYIWNTKEMMLIRLRGNKGPILTVNVTAVERMTGAYRNIYKRNSDIMPLATLHLRGKGSTVESKYVVNSL